MEYQIQHVANALQAAHPIRVLIVDDSALMRKLISEIVNAQPDMEVVGTAFDGKDALNKTRQWQPDVVSLDIEMPRCNGLEYLENMMRECPTRTLVVSSLTQEGAETTLKCLERGAIECLAKPAGAISLNIAEIGQELVARLRIAAGANLRIHSMPDKNGTVFRPALPSAKIKVTDNETHSGTSRPKSHLPQPIDNKTIFVAVAASTGGPAALHEFLPHLPSELNAAYVLVQHLPPGFAHSLAARLDQVCHLAVKEASETDFIERGRVLVAPGGKHLEVNAHGQIQFNNDPPLWGVRPSADVMMRSLAALFGSRVLGVVLTGMGRDGAIGAKAIKEKGGTCFAQDEQSCVVYGMPRAAVQSGGVARSCSLQEMATAVARQILVMQAHENRKVA